MSKLNGSDGLPNVEEDHQRPNKLEDVELAGYWLASLVDSADDAIIGKTSKALSLVGTRVPSASLDTCLKKRLGSLLRCSSRPDTKMKSPQSYPN